MKKKSIISIILILSIVGSIFTMSTVVRAASTKTVPRVVNVKISYHFFNNQGTQTVIKWDKISGATQYDVAIAKANSQRYFSHFSTTNQITIHTELFENYKVQVRARVNNRWGNYSLLQKSSYFTVLGEGLFNKPDLTLTNASNGISVKWNHCTCVTENANPKYRLYFGYSAKNWVAYKDISSKDTYLKKYGYYPIYSTTLNDGKWKDYYSGKKSNVIPSNLEPGRHYYFQVKMLMPTDYTGKQVQSDKYSSVKSSYYLPIKATLQDTKKHNYKITWGNVSGCTQFKMCVYSYPNTTKNVKLDGVISNKGHFRTFNSTFNHEKTLGYTLFGLYADDKVICNILCYNNDTYLGSSSIVLNP